MNKIFVFTSVFLFIIFVTPFSFASEQVMPYQGEIKHFQEKMSRFSRYAEQLRKQKKIPGMSIAVVQNDKIIYAKGFGVKKSGGNDPVTPKTIFEIGSMSKAFTSALIAMLVDEGKLNWTDRVSDLYPKFRMYDPWVSRNFLLKDLMAQHSGLAPYAGDGLAMFGYGSDHIIHSLRYIKPISSFRSEYAYQNTLFLLAGKIIEKYTEKSWKENVKEKIFDPLGMKYSSADANTFKHTKDVAFLHREYQGKLYVIPMDWPYFDWIETYAPAGVINSNVLDISRWVSLHLNEGIFRQKRLISTKNIRFLRTPSTFIGFRKAPTQEDLFYAQGWVYENCKPYPIIWHTGGTSGASTIVAFVPDVNLAVIIFTNKYGSLLPNILMKTLIDDLFGNEKTDWNRVEMEREKKREAAHPVPLLPKSITPALPLDQYVGVYGNQIYGQIPIVLERGELVATVGPKRYRLILKHRNRDTFEIIWPGGPNVLPPVPKDAPGFFVFSSRDEGMNLSQVTITALNEDGLGIFTRKPVSSQ